jgi:hypothetical protein
LLFSKRSKKRSKTLLNKIKKRVKTQKGGQKERNEKITENAAD